MKVVYYFTGAWCAPCKAYLPVVEAVMKGKNIDFRVIDVQAFSGIAEEFQVNSVPCMRCECNGLMRCLDGVQPARKVEAWLQELK